MRVRLRIRRFWRARADDGLPPAPRGLRLLVGGAAIAITLAIGAALLLPHLDFLRHRQAADRLARCAPGQTQGCVGGTMAVIVAPPASTPRP